MPAECHSIVTCFKMLNSGKKQNLPQTVNHFETNTIIWLSDRLMLSVGVQHMQDDYALLNIFSDLGAGRMSLAPAGAAWPEEAGIPPLSQCYLDYSVLFWGRPSSRGLF